MRPTSNNKRRIGIIALAVAVALAIPATALLSDTTVERQFVRDDEVKDAAIRDSDAERVSIKDASIDGSRVAQASVKDASISGSYLSDLEVKDAQLADSRVERASMKDVSLDDVTVCQAEVNKEFGYGDCALVRVDRDGEQVFARLTGDAPATIAPGDSYDLEVRDAEAATLTVRNDPGGLVGLGFEPGVDPLGLQQLGFLAAANNESVASFELLVDGEVRETFGFGDTVELPQGDFTLRVNANQTGIVDHSRLALVLDLEGHGLRPAITSFDVVATNLVIPPVEDQLFAPFLADNVARLVLSVPVDADGNVDRDVNTTFRVDVTDVRSEGATLRGDMDQRARLHDDSRLFSEAPFSYRPEVTAAHHPQTLELLVRENLVAELEYGAIDAYGTHLVAMGPHATNVTLEAEAQNARGENLSASIDIEMGATPDEERTETFFGTDFDLPGRGTLQANFVDAEGQPVQAGEGWTLFIQETPDSHGVQQSIAVDAGATGASQDLAASKQLATPLGNFASSEYRVCVDHDDRRDCAQGGELVPIRTGETSSVDIRVG